MAVRRVNLPVLRRGAMALALALFCPLVSSCALARKQDWERLTEARNATPARVAGYVLFGLPRDLLDAPFAAVDRLFYYRTVAQPDSPLIDLGRHLTANEFELPQIGVLGLIGVSSCWVYGIVREPCWPGFWGRPLFWTSAGALGGALAYPATAAPVEDILFRWPHNQTLFGVGYRNLQDEAYDYLPNLDLFFPKSNRGRRSASRAARATDASSSSAPTQTPTPPARTSTAKNALANSLSR